MIRDARLDELGQVVALWNAYGGPTRHAARIADASRLLRRDPAALLVAEEECAIVGTLVVGWDGWRCHLYRLAVEPTFRRTGVAGHLLAEARRRASAYGAVRIDAMVDPANTGAEAFWSSAGFVADADRRWSLSLG